MKKKLLIICIVLALAATGVIYGFTYRTTTASKTSVKKVTKTQCTKYKACSKSAASQVNYRVKNCNGNGASKTSLAKATSASIKN